MTRVIPLISQVLSMSDRFSFLREEQKEAVRSEMLNSKARNSVTKRASSVKEDDNRVLPWYTRGL